MPYNINEYTNKKMLRKKSKYRAFSIKQPFVLAILCGIKIFENRNTKVIPLIGSTLKQLKNDKK